MRTSELSIFRGYLRSLPYDLLESVTGDYVWLSGLRFNEARHSEFRNRRTAVQDRTDL
jgi:hypothetical protein